LAPRLQLPEEACLCLDEMISVPGFVDLPRRMQKAVPIPAAAMAAQAVQAAPRAPMDTAMHRPPLAAEGGSERPT